MSTRKQAEVLREPPFIPDDLSPDLLFSNFRFRPVDLPQFAILSIYKNG
jgi:hypothetical protein